MEMQIYEGGCSDFLEIVNVGGDLCVIHQPSSVVFRFGGHAKKIYTHVMYLFFQIDKSKTAMSAEHKRKVFGSIIPVAKVKKKTFF